MAQTKKFRRCFADGLNHSLVSTSAQAIGMEKENWNVSFVDYS